MVADRAPLVSLNSWGVNRDSINWRIAVLSPAEIPSASRQIPAQLLARSRITAQLFDRACQKPLKSSNSQPGRSPNRIGRSVAIGPGPTPFAGAPLGRVGWAACPLALPLPDAALPGWPLKPWASPMGAWASACCAWAESIRAAAPPAPSPKLKTIASSPITRRVWLLKWRVINLGSAVMWLIFLEAGLALAIFLFIIWWTMRGKR